jgi:hypothetical protein
MDSKFEKLVRGMSPEMLEELRRTVLEEANQRRQPAGVQIEQIRPDMSREQRERAAQEIARILRGEDQYA